jgi:hypothetical protein
MSEGAEPESAAAAPTGRFVVLCHDGPHGRHWDFMLEVGAVLKTWALEAAPDAPQPQAAVALADHRPLYLEYEGPLSAGRGTVARWDTGVYRLARRTAAEWVVLVEGGRLAGRVTLAPAASTVDRWQFSFTASR